MPVTLTDEQRILEAQLRECFGRVVYSHKTHEKCADILLARQETIKLIQIGLSAVTTAGFISTAFGTGHVGAIVGGLVSVVLLGLNLYKKNDDLGQLAQKHRQTAVELWHVRERYLSLITDLLTSDTPSTEIRTQRDSLLDSLHHIYAAAPNTNGKAYKKAQRALKYKEEHTFSDKEIDVHLPEELRKSNHDKSGTAKA